MTQVRTNDANNANTNRIVRFDIAVDLTGIVPSGAPVVNDQVTDASDIFASLQGPNYNYKHYGKVQNPTQAQILAQLRLSLITRSLSRYAILVGVQLADAGAETSNAVRLEFETDRTGVFYNNDWSTDQSVDKNIVADIADTVGTGGMNAPKTKAGLQKMLDELAAVSYDDGVTYVFGWDSSAGVTLPDGTSATGPSLASTNTPAVPVYSGLQIVWDNPAKV